MKLKTMKRETRIVGICGFKSSKAGEFGVSVVGVVYRGGCWLDGIMATKVKAKNRGLTEKIARMITGSPHYRQTRIVMLYETKFFQLNRINLERLHRKLKLPIIAVTGRKAAGARGASATIKPIPIATEARGKPIYVGYVGLEQEEVTEIVKASSTRGRLPEPIRVAELICTALQDKR